MHLAGHRSSSRAVNHSHQALNSSPLDRMAANLADDILIAFSWKKMYATYRHINNCPWLWLLYFVIGYTICITFNNNMIKSGIFPSIYYVCANGIKGSIKRSRNAVTINRAVSNHKRSNWSSKVNWQQHTKYFLQIHLLSAQEIRNVKHALLHVEWSLRQDRETYLSRTTEALHTRATTLVLKTC